ncbi:glycosyltransferase family 4 protein [Rivularia sp. UHCC 0363]|uniref:glycosyltransferase family 4 protein n=1 Tax=Rivularia sp. UHCC 0363 TaxID=3110244 RepID=UPI002B209C20|nr:glycosyltransferase family 4 protein [Rivularia sp. UHCC 0363]MEA5595416.1 glycosyltransferase family 4 protein [Rivularia sp. UHCC 0363]
MKIIHILNDIQEIGNGIINVAVDIACLQAKNGHDVAVVSDDGEYEILLNKYGVKHYHLNQKRTPQNIMKAGVIYRQIIKDFQPDIVHAHMMTGMLLASGLRFGNNYGLVSTVHNEFKHESILMGLADRVIAVSKVVAQSMKKRGISEDKLRVICNGTLGSPRNPIHEYQNLQLHHPAILTVAGMYQRKGITVLINAFEQIADLFPQSHLYLVGNGPDKEMFETQAKQLSCIDRIHFEGYQPEPQRYLNSCDIFVLASFRDPCPLVLSEAREAGCAIIATEVDGIPEALDYGEAGLLVPPQNSQALANKMINLVNDANALHEWKNRAGQNLERLNVNRVYQETLAVYQEIKG